MPGRDDVSSTSDEPVSTGAAIVAVAVPETLSANAEIGKLAYDAKCAVCHGADAAGQDGAAPPLVHKIYEPSHHGEAAFLLAAKNGVRAHHWRFGNMPTVEGVTDGDVKMIVTYVRELQRANGIN
ncbi:c-type cytochrome [Roseobacter litoralis]|uniref:Cytochrome c-like protein n=1 Tax=Roseobacter litoralis (strain ATCC 49566 / DSM 6996 / JCM 21268 / NBRC 15278 / OCh 149) TaxID=391595 RepID=F7ZMH6_ROSLO|nr:cytochrome c-like protein [Roseobacter litoralis Och 149]